MQQRPTPLRWLWLIPGIALFVVGIIVGLSSHQIVYQKSSQGTAYQIYIGSLGNIYLNADGSADYFIARKEDFNPPIDTTTVDSAASVDFVARADTVSVNAKIESATISDAHPIEQLTFYDGSGQALTSYTTSEYTAYLADPASHSYQNQWPLGAGLIIIGILIDGMILLVLLSRRSPGTTPAVDASVILPGYPQSHQAGYPQPYYPQPPYVQPPYPGQPGVLYTPSAQYPPQYPQPGASPGQFIWPEGQITPGQQGQYTFPPRPQE
jgi:hypothetical protein